MRTFEGWGFKKDPPLSEVLSVLQLRTIDEPLLPNLKTFGSLFITGELVQFIPLLLSPRTTVFWIGWITVGKLDFPKVMVASMIIALPTRCPNLQDIILPTLRRDPVITAAVSEMVLATNRNTLRRFRVDSPLTDEAREMICNLSDLRELLVVIERDTALPSVVLPNLTNLTIRYYNNGDWLRVFRRATLGKLEAVTFHSESEQISGFLEIFERVALAASLQNTLSKFHLHTSLPWNPNYSSLLPFTQLTSLVIDFSCAWDCSSNVDDELITNLAQTMPKLGTLQLGDPPCGEIIGSVTAKGLMVLAHHCPDLTTLRIHFQATTLIVPPVITGVTGNVGSTSLRRRCALRELVVGDIPVPQEYAPEVGRTLLHIFSRIEGINYFDEDWEEVIVAIRRSGQTIDRSHGAFKITLVESDGEL